MSIYVFCGPTLRGYDARRILDAVYLPPVSQGDIAALLRSKPTVIGIIDGYFESVPAVWHKEILLALAEGVHVIGGASMGALRAAELDAFGMVGVGEVFAWYRDGIVEADDEVAVRHAPAEYDYRPLNEALVNIRKTLAAAHERGVITRATRDELIRAGQATPYWDRSYDDLLKRGLELRIDRTEIERLRRFVDRSRIDLKRRDALELLRYIADLPRERSAGPPGFELQRTVFLAGMIDRDRPLTRGNGTRLTPSLVVDHARLAAKDFPALKNRAAVDALTLAFARQLCLAVDDEELRREMADFRRERGLTTEADLRRWRARNHLSETELEQLVAELAVIRKTQAIYASELSNSDLLRRLRVSGRYERYARAALEKQAILAPGEGPGNGSVSGLLAAYFARRGERPPEDPYDFAARLGFEDYASFLLELEREGRHRSHCDKENRS